MVAKDIFKLNSGEKVNHKHYGICTVNDTIPEFGVLIVPDSKEGLSLLRNQSGMIDGTPLLETTFRLILSKVSED